MMKVIFTIIIMLKMNGFVLISKIRKSNSQIIQLKVTIVGKIGIIFEIGSLKYQMMEIDGQKLMNIKMIQH